MRSEEGAEPMTRYQPVGLQGRAQRVTVYVGESVRYQHHPLYTEIVHRAHARGMAGVTVLRGIEGYGASNHLHTTRLLSLSQDLPLVVILVDTHERIAGFLPELEAIVRDGLVLVEEVDVVAYSGRRPDASR